jgi:hypothetical protein
VNDPSARRRSERRSGRRRSENSAVRGRYAPRLVVDATLEELPLVRIEADSFEDELRLRSWLRRTSVRRRLLDVLDDLLEREAA